MAITDELREWYKDRLFMGNGWAEIDAIADRIDAAHRSALEKLAAQLDEGEDGWVRLPVDADGVPIRVGDVLTHGTVGCIRLTTKGWEIVVGYNGGSGMFNPSAMHHRTPTVEDVLLKMLEQAVGYSDAHTTVALDTIAEFAAKLRLAGEDE